MAKPKKVKNEEKTPERAKVENIEEIVVDLAKKGNSPAKIGTILKQQYGIQKAKILGKSITKILEKHKVEYPDDLACIENKIKKIESHYSKNKQDKRAQREIVRLVSMRKKLKAYKLKKEGKRDVGFN